LQDLVKSNYSFYFLIKHIDFKFSNLLLFSSVADSCAPLLSEFNIQINGFILSKSEAAALAAAPVLLSLSKVPPIALINRQYLATH